MASRDAFADQFRQLLNDLPDDYTLDQWQQAYRQAIFIMGMQILERFEAAAIAEQFPIEKHSKTGETATTELLGGGPIVLHNFSHGGGPGGGGNPSRFRPCRFFPDYPLSLRAARVFRGRDKK
ncbi:MAG TPA: hypothetical protein VHW95_03465 [Steroidobacteraceae bacterium]|jgi:hypothetical protein|nr:hypothetical protein [Steroidobacteraceae bacterium]